MFGIAGGDAGGTGPLGTVPTGIPAGLGGAGGGVAAVTAGGAAGCCGAGVVPVPFGGAPLGAGASLGLGVAVGGGSPGGGVWPKAVVDAKPSKTTTRLRPANTPTLRSACIRWFIHSLRVLAGDPALCALKGCRSRGYRD
jgi:hypothetical protein